MTTLFVVLACRSLRRTFAFDLDSNGFLVFTLAISLLLMLLAVYWPPLQLLLRTAPLALWEWVLVAGLGLLEYLMIEMAKGYLLIPSRRAKRSES